MDTYKDAHYRSILKAISFRFVATATTIAIVFILTRSLALSAIAGVADVVSKLILYYLHERVWDVIGFGKIKHPLASLKVKQPIGEKGMQEIKNKLKELGHISED